ncbi:uncharacterized protein ARMOST_08241 [Armillaria ostoyae]|uniref:ATP-dependent DNA helicase n=1 Tax=Armillaria ostoyae TaxID=47428 RepID=A0A284R838_ARMOS|nr:uncharacterized protein ARMOST_08241 [Armillaria ostoyae]
MPPPAGILSALISITFIQPNKKLQYPFPTSLHVRCRVVFEALTWLQCYNPLWANIYIDEGHLQQLPENGVPEEITLTAQVSNDFDVLAQEQSGYVSEPSDDDNTVFNDLYPNMNASTADQGSTDGEVVSKDINLQFHGVVDANGNEIIDEDLRDHVLVNSTLPPDSASFSEECFKSDDRLRMDREPSNLNHLLGAFLVLFPFGFGGFETSWYVNVPYEVHARWVLMYADRHFHQDLHFVFQVFDVMQKWNICQSSVLQMLLTSYHRHQPLISTLKPKDLLLASKQEKHKTPFTNPAVQTLRTELTAITVNLNDTHDPIAQVIAEENIDLDHFLAYVGPTAALRAKTIAADPYTSTKFFHLITEYTLKALLGISVQSSCGHYVISREKGIFGMVNTYIRTIEAQGQGSLHMHVLIWLKGSLTASEMNTALQSEEFHLHVSTFITQNIVVDIGGLSASDILAALELKDPSYSRSLKTDYLDPTHIVMLAWTVQVHTCHDLQCLIKVNNRKVCKQRAPFPRSEEAWIDKKGEWGPRHLYGYVNNFNSPLLVTTRSNHDIKLITNAFGTNNLTWYLTIYMTKKQGNSSNASAVLAKMITFHKHTTSVLDDNRSVNKHLLQCCTNTLGCLQEFSAQEAPNLFEWNVDGIISLISKLETSLESPTKVENGGSRSSEDTSTIRLEFHEDILKPKDQVQEYVDRGLPMQCINMFDFFVNTYDTKKCKLRSEKQNGATIGDSQTAEDEGDESSEDHAPEQLLMMVLGAGGTGKMVLINAIHETFNYHNCVSSLGLMATSGIAAMLFGGSTIHSWAGVLMNSSSNKLSRDVAAKCQAHMGINRLLVIDEISMFEKSLLCKLSDSAMVTRSQIGLSNADRPFGGMNMIISRDFHQFPPVTNVHAALYNPANSSDLATWGHALYRQFETVVLLKDQILGECMGDDVNLLDSVTLDSLNCLPTDLSQPPWRDAIFITSQNSAKNDWNAEALQQHCERTGAIQYHCPAEDYKGKACDELTMLERLVVAGLNEKKTGKLTDVLEIAVGMKAMVTLNIATESDLTNGTRGTVEDIVLDPHEPIPQPNEHNIVDLTYPPALIKFRPMNNTNVPMFEGLSPGVLPIIPLEISFLMKPKSGFTHHKGQGQTLDYVKVDLADPPRHPIDAFHAYVALSRSHGQSTVRILRPFNIGVLMTPLCLELTIEDVRLETLDEITQERFENGEYTI